MTNHARRALVASAGVALALHATLGVVRGGIPVPQRVALAATAVLLVLASRWTRGPGPVRYGAMAAAVLLVWWGVLELCLAFGTVYAAGLLAIVAGALIHFTLGIGLLGARRASLRVGVAVAATATAAWLAEASVRIFVPVSVYEIVADGIGNDDECIVQDGDVTRLAPGFHGAYRHPEFPGLRVEINDLGLRDGLDETPPADGDVSVLVLGDSFVFGTGVPVEETFHERLEERADVLAPGRRLRVYGAGVPGHGQVHAETQLARLAPTLRPDVVVVAIYEGNDFVDNMNLEGRRLGKIPSIEEQDERSARERRSGRAGRDLATFLRGVTRAPYWLGSSSLVQLVLPGLEERLVRWGVVEPFVPANRFIRGMLRVPPPDFVQLGRAHLRIVAARLREQCAALDAALVFLPIPTALQADVRRFEQFVESRPKRDRTGLDRRAFHDGLAAELREAGFDVADPIDGLERSVDAKRPPYLREGHWNAAGHAAAAEALETVLTRLLARRE